VLARLAAIAVALGTLFPAAAAASPLPPVGGDPAVEHLRAHELQRSLAAQDDVAPAYRTSSAEVEPVAEPASVEPQSGGRWGQPFAIPVMGIHAVLLPTGKVLWWSYPQNPDEGLGDPAKAQNTATAWLYDPATGESRRVDPPLERDPVDGQLKPANIWCSGQSLLADGRVLVTGGNLAYKGDDLPDDGKGPLPSYAGLDKVYTFNPFNETWTKQPDMAHGRWYPTQTLLPDGPPGRSTPMPQRRWTPRIVGMFSQAERSSPGLLRVQESFGSGPATSSLPLGIVKAWG
jgi:hypothetical protein